MTGQWIGASSLIGRPVPVDGPYPHICGIELTGRMTGVHVRLGRRDCAACATTTGQANRARGDDQ